MQVAGTDSILPPVTPDTTQVIISKRTDVKINTMQIQPRIQSRWQNSGCYKQLALFTSANQERGQVEKPDKSQQALDLVKKSPVRKPLPTVSIPKTTTGNI